MKQIIIVGSGIGGLSAAALLGKAGYSVTVLEKNEQPGGRASKLTAKGFTFDMGPSWYLMPDVFETFYKEFGKKPSDYFTLKKLDPSYKIFFGSKDTVLVPSTYSKVAKLFDGFEENGKEKLDKYINRSEFLYKESIKNFVYQDYKSFKDFAKKDLLFKATKIPLFENIDQYTKKFFSSDKARKILMYNIVFLGGTPKNTPALYSLMSYIDFKMGVWYPLGGISAFIDSLVSLCKDYNVKVIYNTEVKKLEIKNGVVSKILTNKKTYTADTVVMNADYHFAETKLLPLKYQSYPESFWKKKTIAPSAFILYLGINKKLSKLTHHNLFLDNDWTKHFDSIFKNPSWPKDPSYYVCVPSKTDPNVAPRGMENVFVLVPVAAGLKDTPEIRKKYTQKVIKHLEELIGEEFSENIVYKKTFAHADFAKRYNAYKGTGLGLSHTLLQTAIFRPHHVSKKVKNLYYTGQYTHPGIGMPVCLISSTIVSNLIQKDNEK
ncbi:MAG: phytoene desaturase [Candidatus Levybacteria bacterium]|nr:phytoene desaturase [Candidatus Levybacteria bacterium]